MSSALLAITYGSITIGGTSGRDIDGGWRHVVTPERSEVSCSFVTSAASAGAMATEISALKAGLSLPRQKLEIKVGSTAFESLDPTSGTLTAYEPEPELSLDPDQPPANMNAVRFRLRIAYRRPRTAIAGQSGRDYQARYAVTRTLQDRREVSFSGVWTSTDSTGASDAFDAAFDAYADGVLGDVDPAASWTRTSLVKTPNDSGTELAYTATYWEVVGGRRSASIQVDLSPAGRKTVTITGEYVTVGATTAKQAYDNNEDTHSGAALTTIGGTYDKPRETTAQNDQGDVLTFTRVYLEILHNQQSGTAQDSTVIDDRWTLTKVRSAPGDSQVDGVAVARPIVATVDYAAWLARGTEPRTKWEGGLRDYVLAEIVARLGVTGVILDGESLKVDPTDNRIEASLRVLALSGQVLQLEIEETVSDDFGSVFTPMRNGQDHVYHEDREAARRVKTRRVTGVVTGGRTPESFAIGNHDRYRVLRRSVPVKKLVQGLGPSTAVVVFSLTEEFLYVLSTGAVSGSTGRTVSRDPAPTTQSAGGAGTSFGSGGGSTPAALDRLSGPGQSAGTSFGADLSGFSFGVQE